jgi:hypothetical protein
MAPSSLIAASQFSLSTTTARQIAAYIEHLVVRQVGVATR